MTTPQSRTTTAERHSADAARQTSTPTVAHGTERVSLPTACGPVSAALRVTLSVSPDRPRVILSLVGQLDRAIIATDDLLAADDLLLADRLLEGLHEALWQDVDDRWAHDPELREAHSMLRSAMREARERVGL